MIAIVLLLMVGLGLALLPWRRVALWLVILAGLWATSYFLLPSNVWEPLVLLTMPPLIAGWLVGLLARATLRRMRVA
ncbi:hypothetical protein [Sulfitobacter guttiformis]|uniref:Uncharacterized protein n=1 Tax=Sulfitobacter guttiformis TaxID=74349 RepID=A0A420DNK7_9RHOB|nr:hypothetical protein [Sulfitobacter guttiformis]KIN73082.1 hypothetical protein Z949_2264 [Sulfitobacter guttiformis KCTC 32187]RKE95768.1 hypothetical protein C8N30_0305 [Sulfitobacter guttiformis]